MKREDVEALLAACERDRIGPHPSNETLAALCRRWLAVEDAPVVTFWLGDHDGVYEVDSPEEGDSIKPGQRVRIVPEDGQGVGRDA